MKKLLLITFLISIVSCKNNTNNKTIYSKKIESNKTIKDSVKENINDIRNKITIETSKSPCIITKIYSKNNKNIIIVDYTKITDKEEEDSGMPIYENKNPKLRTFLINDSTQITIFNWKKNTDTGVWKITVDEFLKNKEKQISDYTKWNIEVKNGIVKKLSEIYYP